MSLLNNIILASIPMVITGDNFHVEFKKEAHPNQAHYLFTVPSNSCRYMKSDYFIYNETIFFHGLLGKITEFEQPVIIETADDFEKCFQICIEPRLSFKFAAACDKANETFKATGEAADRFSKVIGILTGLNGEEIEPVSLVEIEDNDGEIIGYSTGFRVTLNEEQEKTKISKDDIASCLCVAAKWVENALHTLDVAQDTDDDYLITCAEQNLEKARNEMAKYIEAFENI